MQKYTLLANGCVKPHPAVTRCLRRDKIGIAIIVIHYSRFVERTRRWNKEESGIFVNHRKNAP